MAQFRNIFPVDLQTGYKDPVPLMQPVGEGDAKGVRVGASVTNNGADVDLGGQCVGKVIRADGSTVPLTGTISGNQAYVTLDQTCCAIEGPIQVAVAWVSGTNITTLVIAYGTVVNTITGNTVQPSTPIPDLTQLLAEIDAMRTATAAANAAAEKSVRYDTAQSLTAAQQLTARNNISTASAADLAALADNKAVRYDTTQELTTAQKNRAIGNIGAASAADLTTETTEREAADNELKSAINDISESVDFAKVTDDLSVLNNGVTFTKESDNKFKYYGTATANRNQLFLNGQDDIMISSSAFKKTLEAGTYHIEALAEGYKTTGWSLIYTYTTFASASYLARPIQLSATLTFTDPVMIGFQFSSGTDYGTSENPSYITLNITKPSAVDLVSRDTTEQLTSDLTATDTNVATIKGALPSLSNASGLWTKINDNTDYNDLTTPGTYICLSYTSGLSMINCPTAIAHKLFVIATANVDRVYQVIFPNDINAEIFKRVFTGTAWGAWKKEVSENANYKILVIGDSYSEQGRWLTQLGGFIKIDSIVNLGVGSASLKDKYTDRITYPYTSRPTKNDNTGNHNTFMCQIEKLKRLMAGSDLDAGETQIYTSEDDYPNVIIIEGGQNDSADSSAVEETYANQFMKQVDNVYVSYNSDYAPELGSTYIKLPSEECNRTCFAGAYRSLVEELQTLFPKAQIFATSRSLLGYWRAKRFPTVTTIRQQQELACNMVGINFINWQAGAQINLMNNYPKGSGTENDPYCYAQVEGALATHDTYDLLHPWTLGAKKYAKVVANAIRTQYLDMENM